MLSNCSIGKLSCVKLSVVLTIILNAIIIRDFTTFYVCILFRDIWSSAEPDRYVVMLLHASLKLTAEY